ncbi:MAG: ribosome maturation factor RimM [Gammaproteobacteria bacterium]|nr:ribosome maturation factor RimM [Gammaproteobacteria bacterium]
MPMVDDPSGLVIVGRISGLFGVRGWLKIFSYTEPRENIVEYGPWLLNTAGQWRPVKVESGRVQGKGVVVKLIGCDDRDAAALLVGCDIAINREQLGKPEPGEYYWADLEGLKVVNLQGVDLGVIDHLFATGANDVIVVRGERERLLPFIRGDVIRNVDLQRGVMEVDWDPEF